MKSIATSALLQGTRAAICNNARMPASTGQLGIYNSNPLLDRGRGYHHDGRHKFVDRIRLEVLGGTGGKGIISFESIDNLKRRPIGGHGGPGGDVVIEASRTVRDLNFQTYVIRGHDGRQALGKGGNAKGGRIKRIMVPVGTVIKEVQRVYDYGGVGNSADDDYAYVPADVLESHASAASSSDAFSDSSEDEDTIVSPLRRALESDSDGGGDSDDVSVGRGRSRGARRARPPVESDSDEGLDEADESSSDGWQVVTPPSADARGQGGGSDRGDRRSRGMTREDLQPASPEPSPPVRRVNKAGIPFSETSVAVADMDAHGQLFLAARGGQPGQGNKGSTLNYAEQVRGAGSAHVAGSRGQTRFLELELKSIADAGLVGFPNAGKSSLLGAVSKAKPKVADYPFTTLHPTVGVLSFGDGFTLTMADIPGLIEGAHLDRGLGHEFLRHIERTRVLMYVIDASGDGGGSGDPAADLRALQHELRMYDPELPRRPSLVIANKCDLPRGKEGAARLRSATSLPVLEVSALSRAGVGHAVNSLRWLLEAQQRMAAAQSPSTAG